MKTEITGMHAKDIGVSLTDGVLTLRGERKLRTEEKDENFHRMHRSYGAFARFIRLPTEVQIDKMTANCKNGVLKITLPKTEKAKSREVKIKVE